MSNPIKGQGYSFYVSLIDQANPLKHKTSPTLAAGDVVAITGGASSNVDPLPTETAAGSGVLLVSLTGAQTNADDVAVVFRDVAGSEWTDLTVALKPQASAEGGGDCAYNPMQLGASRVRMPISDCGSSAGYCKDPICLHESDGGWIGVDFSAITADMLEVVSAVTISATDSAGDPATWATIPYNGNPGGVWGSVATVQLSGFSSGDSGTVEVVVVSQSGATYSGRVLVNISPAMS